MAGILKNIVVRILFSVYGWSVVGVICIVTFCLQSVLLLATFPFDPDRHISGRFFRLSAVLISKCMIPMWNFGTYGKLPQKSPQRTVFVCNHRSMSDSTLLSYLPWEMKYLIKKSMTIIPFTGWSMLLAGDIPLVRGNKDSATIAMKKCKDYVLRGSNILIFPEGTRSKTGVMGEFKDGAFRLAIEAQADLCPLALAGTEDSLAVSSFIFGHSKAVVTVGKPISTKGMTLDDVEKLKEAARKQIETMYKEIYPRTQF